MVSFVVFLFLLDAPSEFADLFSCFVVVPVGIDEQTGCRQIERSGVGVQVPVVGYDVSETALKVAESNAAAMGAEIEFHRSDIRDVDEGADTVFMNPPFGCQNRNADRAFLRKAMELSECVYSIHMAETVDFVEGFCHEFGRDVKWRKTYKYEIPHTFSFHKKAKMSVDIAVVNIR